MTAVNVHGINRGANATQRGIPEDQQYYWGRGVASRYWHDWAPLGVAFGLPDDRKRSADELLAEARDQLGTDVSPEEERGFRDRWAELQQGGVE